MAGASVALDINLQDGQTVERLASLLDTIQSPTGLCCAQKKELRQNLSAGGAAGAHHPTARFSLP